MRRLMGAVIGFLLFFPGALFLRWVVVELGLYQQVSLTDALLAIIIILACVIVFGQPRRALTAEELESQAERRLRSSRLSGPGSSRSQRASDRDRGSRRRR